MNLNEERGDFCAKIRNKNLIIEIPLNILIQSQKLRDDRCYDVLDKSEMGIFFADNIIWHTRNMGDQETGASELTHLIDDIFDYAYECGETWLEESEYYSEYKDISD